MAFGSVPAGLRIGDAIEWVNDDIFQHTATARDGSFDVILPPQSRVRTVLRRAGQIPFYCRYHPGMTGRLTVAG
jgi:plastocyanin